MIGWASLLWILNIAITLLGSLHDLYGFWNVVGREGLIGPLLNIGIAFLTLSITFHTLKTELPYLLDCQSKKSLAYIGVILVLVFTFLGVLH